MDGVLFNYVVLLIIAIRLRFIPSLFKTNKSRDKRVKSQDQLRKGSIHLFYSFGCV